MVNLHIIPYFSRGVFLKISKYQIGDQANNSLKTLFYWQKDLNSYDVNLLFTKLLNAVFYHLITIKGAELVTNYKTKALLQAF